MRFGTEIRVDTLDDNGSTMSVSQPIYEFKAQYSLIRKEIRIRVKSMQDELEQFLKFQQERSKLPNMVDIEFRVENPERANSGGYYYIVKCFTIKQTS